MLPSSHQLHKSQRESFSMNRNAPDVSLLNCEAAGWTMQLYSTYQGLYWFFSFPSFVKSLYSDTCWYTFPYKLKIVTALLGKVFEIQSFAWYLHIPSIPFHSYIIMRSSFRYSQLKTRNMDSIQNYIATIKILFTQNVISHILRAFQTALQRPITLKNCSVVRSKVIIMISGLNSKCGCTRFC